MPTTAVVKECKRVIYWFCEQHQLWQNSAMLQGLISLFFLCAATAHVIITQLIPAGKTMYCKHIVYRHFRIEVSIVISV
jgi:hypothetical protein